MVNFWIRWVRSENEPPSNVHFSVETVLHFTQKEPSEWKRGWIQSSEPCPTVCDRGQQGPRVAGGRGWCEFHPASAGGMIRQCSQLPQLEVVFPHLDFITLLKRSSELALPGHGRDGSTLDERWACARPCSGDVGYSYFSLWPPSQGTLGAVGQVNQRAGNRLNIDVEGDKTVAPLNSEAFIDPG